MKKFKRFFRNIYREILSLKWDIVNFLKNIFFFWHELIDVYWGDGHDSLRLIRRHLQLMDNNWHKSYGSNSAEEHIKIKEFLVVLDRVIKNEYCEAEREVLDEKWGELKMVNLGEVQGMKSVTFVRDNILTEQDEAIVRIEEAYIRALKQRQIGEDKRYICENLWAVLDLWD